MIVKVLANQVKDYKDIIEEVMDRSFPETAMATKTAIFRDIMLDLVDVWFYMENEDKIGIVYLTRLNDDYAVGRKTMTILGVYALIKVNEAIALECYQHLKKYSQSKDCYFIDFYTDNDRIKYFADMFPTFWKASYYQLSLEN